VFGGPTRKYLKMTRSSPAGNRTSHLKQATLPWRRPPGKSIATTLYFAPQLLKENGSEFFMAEIKKVARASDYCSRDGLLNTPRNLLGQTGYLLAHLCQSIVQNSLRSCRQSGANLFTKDEAPADCGPRGEAAELRTLHLPRKIPFPENGDRQWGDSFERTAT
jgi:hypothetical protein